MRSAARFAAILTVLAATTAAQAGSPRLNRVFPSGGQRGTTVKVVLIGRYLDDPKEMVFYEPGITFDSIEPLKGDFEFNGRQVTGGTDRRLTVVLKVAKDCPLGPHGMRLRTLGGMTDYQRFFVSPFPAVDEDEQAARNDKPEGAKKIAMNSTVDGRMNDQADVDLYKVEAHRGERVSAEIEAARIGVLRGIPDLYVAILDDKGKRLVEADDSALFIQDPVASVIADRDGSYFVQVRHSTYSAANDTYRLHVGSFPRPTGLYPAGGQAGTEVALRVLGDPRGAWSTTVRLPADRTGGYPFAAVDPDTGVSAPSPNTLRISPFPNLLEVEPNDAPDAVSSGSSVDLPVAFNGIIEKPGDVDCFRFAAKKGDRFKVHALANAIGSPLDPTIWIKSLGGKSNGVVARASDSRANQLGIPQVQGLNRDTLDPILEFAVPADGEYVLGVEDERGEGGPDAVYRVEFTRETDAIYTYIAPEPENRFNPQTRQAVSVAAGNRYNTQVAILNTNRSFKGELELEAVGLPEGVTMSAPRFKPGMSRVPVVFEATADAKPVAKFIELIVKPVDGKDGKAVASGYRQVIPMNMYGNQDFYLHPVIDKLLVAVTEPAAFRIQVEEPRSALVQNGEMLLKFTIQRAKGFEGAVTVNLEWRPEGVHGSTPVTVAPDKTEGEYRLAASRGASSGTYPVILTAYTGGNRSNFYERTERTYVASQSFKLTVAEPHLEAKFVRASVERGKTAKLVCKLSHLRPFKGKATATLTRLPRGVELVEPTREFTTDDSEVVFSLRATEDCLVGSYQGIALEATVVEEGQAMRQVSGHGMLRIDPERGPLASAR